MRGGSTQPWYTDIRARIRFEREVREAYPGCNVTPTGRGMKAKIVYMLTVDVPEYPPRRVTITLPNWSTPSFPAIKVDGPTESPHRYGGRQLCIWHPDAPAEERWIPEDGLLALIDHTRVHLFKEAYWRETGIWAGSEAPHDLKEGGR
jgi:hypothetical protein